MYLPIYLQDPSIRRHCRRRTDLHLYLHRCLGRRYYVVFCYLARSYPYLVNQATALIVRESSDPVCFPCRRLRLEVSA